MKVRLLFLVLLSLAAARAHAATWINQPVDVSLFRSPTLLDARSAEALVTVGPGVELTGFGTPPHLPQLAPFLDIDLSPNNILITLITDQPQENIQSLTFWPRNNPSVNKFKSVTINPATNWANFNATRVYNPGHFVNVNLPVLFGLKGQQISLDVTFTDNIPEPSGLTLTAISALLILRRKAK